MVDDPQTKPDPDVSRGRIGRAQARAPYGSVPYKPPAVDTPRKGSAKTQPMPSERMHAAKPWRPKGRRR